MKKNLFLLLCLLGLFAGKSFAQKCATDEESKRLKQLHPEIAVEEERFNQFVRQGLSHLDPRVLARTTSRKDTVYYDIPVVLHVIHSYGGADYVTDNDMYNLIARMNRTYSLQYDTSVIIAPFKKYVGKAYIRFHLANRDPQGNVTTGVTRRFSYLTFGGDEQAKVDQWSPTSYYNIWFENVIGMAVAGGTVLAYAHFPSSADSDPYHDGVICAAQFINDGSTLEHETGHYLSLYHTWNSSGAACGTPGACGDDEVDDTPPTVGHPSCGPTPYDTICANNYFKIYPDMSGADSLVNYPDTTNVQNMMDYACELMFTKGQVVRMRYALDSAGGGEIGHRDLLISQDNLSPNFTNIYDASGNLVPRADLKPIPDFFANYSGSKPQYFTCPGTALKFTNKSWRDTITAAKMIFDHGATIDSQTWINPTYSSFVSNSFTDPGWVKIAMTATGNNTGDSTINFNNKIFVADATGTPGTGYIQEFDTSIADGAKWPTFNYFNNEFKWQFCNRGYYDHSSIEYLGYDMRVNPLLGVYPQTGYPKGDYDDLFSTPMDLTGFSSSDPLNMNFMYSGASRSSTSADINDTMIISYSVNGAKNWTNLAVLSKNSLNNKGSLSIPYAPIYDGDWAAKTIPLPAAARTNYVVFRFRFQPNVGSDGYYSSGNNFYMDRLLFSPFTAEVSLIKQDNSDIVIAPNPTSGNAYVIVKNVDNSVAHIAVTDIAGRSVYTTSQQLSGSETRVEIPSSVLSVKGIYMVQTRTGNQNSTQKLVVY